jgi:uncharacterized membrane protein
MFIHDTFDSLYFSHNFTWFINYKNNRLEKLILIENLVLTIGMSLSFIMLFGLIFNISLLSIGYKTPLSKSTLLIGFDLIYILLIIFKYI